MSRAFPGRLWLAITVMPLSIIASCLLSSVCTNEPHYGRGDNGAPTVTCPQHPSLLPGILIASLSLKFHTDFQSLMLIREERGDRNLGPQV
ncbi:hypothetical protein E2C01_035291 [Portunus trituberculatus]|uniref:Uncharacterized protein n=1 Tax=Portunus trituberculatus TaxID=210409 RepID=A0A5B7F2U6_PORTR|nr:hypothetical protein [Portunus trituberculatus]